jgi:hypothetical protein
MITQELKDKIENEPGPTLDELQNEIEVEIEMEFKTECKCGRPSTAYPCEPEFIEVNKLDENDCLILKKK